MTAIPSWLLPVIERLDPDTVAVADGSASDVRKFIESDYRRRNGLCPNGCGLMEPNNVGQNCTSCGFSCNTPAELKPQ